jgi:hypothetical protein
VARQLEFASDGDSVFALWLSCVHHEKDKVERSDMELECVKPSSSCFQRKCESEIEIEMKNSCAAVFCEALCGPGESTRSC